MRFDVSNVRSETHAARLSSHVDQMEQMSGSRVESVSKPPKWKIIGTSAGNQLVEAVGWAFARHYPLVLSPDAIWLTVAQCLSIHIIRNAEDVRKRIVAIEGKAHIVMRGDYH